jgi:branched-chain amino acid transport system substrate-binding protein
MRLGYAVAAVALIVGLLIGAGIGTYVIAPMLAPPPALPIKIGYAGPITGTLANLGTQAYQGAILAAEQYNEKGGVLGRKIEVIVYDSKCVPAEGVSAARKLIIDEGVVAIIGQVCSSVTLAAMPLLQEYEVVGITETSTSPKITQGAGVGGNDWMFRINLPDDINGWVYGKLIVKLGGKRIAMLAVDDDWGRGCVEGFSKTIIEEGGEVVSVDYYVEGEVYFTPVLTKMAGLNPDAFFITARTETGAIIAKQIYELGIDIPIFVQGDVICDTFLDMVGPEVAEGIMACQSWYPEANPPSREFEEAFLERWGWRPWEPAGYGYIAMTALIEAIKASGDATSDGIRRGLKMLDMETFVGRVKFDEHNQAWTQVVVAKYGKGGSVELVHIETVERPEGYWEGTWR